MSNGLDFAWHNALDYGSFRQQGYSFVARYLSYDPGKNLTRDEANAWLGQGIDIVLVWETTANRAEDGYAAGRSDAQAAVAQAAACGAPSEVPIFWAVDEDTTVGPHITGYAQGWSSVIPIRRSGVYGSFAVVRGCFDAGLVAYGWQTYAWSNGQWDPRAHLRQVQNGVNALGTSSDLDQTTGPDYGQWRAGGGGSVVTPSGLVYYPETKPYRLGCAGVHTTIMQQALHLPADGRFGPGTDAALRKWQGAHGLVADGLFGDASAKVLYAPPAPRWSAPPAPPKPPAPSVAFLVQFAGYPSVWEFRHILPKEWNDRHMSRANVHVLADAKALAARPEAHA